MLYTKNKNCFKKTTAKIQHNEARRNILNMVKQVVNRQKTSGNDSQISQQMSENKCQNYDKQSYSHESEQKAAKPIICQSIYASHESLSVKNRIFTIEHVVDYSIKSIQSRTSAIVLAQEEYVKLLQRKIEQLQTIIGQNKKQTEQLECGKCKQNGENIKFHTNFFHRARNVLILQSTELIEYKNQTPENMKNNSRLASTNSILNKCEQLLEVFRSRFDVQDKTSLNKQQTDTQQLKRLCDYQQKTIDFLRKQSQSTSTINEIRLLRHEINRVCQENEQLITRISEAPKRQQLKEVTINLSALQEKEGIINALQSQLTAITTNLKEEKIKSFKLKEEKQFLAEILKEAEIKIEDLEKVVEEYEQQIYQLKLSKTKQTERVLLKQKDIATTEELCRQLKAYPRYFKLLMSIISQYESKVSELQNTICSQRELKEKFMQWSTEVYHLVEQAALPPEVLQKHMDELYRMDRKMSHSKVENFLRQIRSLSIGIDDSDVKEMEAELEEYIISLKCRNQIIKQVDCEDGSSVALSASCYTDKDFQ